MKFGHDLAKVVNVSDPEWAPYFIQYKTLKQHIKAIRAETDANGAPPSPAGRSASPGSSRTTTRWLARVAYYRDLLLLENYAIINYCGFSKILKKHDKRTGFATRSQFMRICVAPQPFTLHPRLLDMIKEAEDLYKEMGAAAKAARDDRAARSAQAAGEPPAPAAAAPTSPPCPRDESDFIDAILNLRTETSKIRAAEDHRVTAGDTPPPTGDGAAFPFASVSPPGPAQRRRRRGEPAVPQPRRDELRVVARVDVEAPRRVLVAGEAHGQRRGPPVVPERVPDLRGLAGDLLAARGAARADGRVAEGAPDGRRVVAGGHGYFADLAGDDELEDLGRGRGRF
ncbi:hypothetical protein JL722_14344 [Aureococcus anophagefferens]|nr:hypothetical protein JL722_14344 [Aureococcus anophagefferens]